MTVTDRSIRRVMQELGRRSGRVKNKPGRFGVMDPQRQRVIASAGGKASAVARSAKVQDCIYCGLPTYRDGRASICILCHGKRVKIERKCRTVLTAAIKRGEIKPAHEFVCVDCKNVKAACYDHRDYRKPLDVEPLCRSCNSKRKPAIFE